MRYENTHFIRHTDSPILGIMNVFRFISLFFFFFFYCKKKILCVKVFANVAYGWKGGMAISGRFRLGNIQTLIKRTGVKGVFIFFFFV